MIRLLILVQIVTVAGLVAVTLCTWDTRLIMLEHDRMILARDARMATLERRVVEMEAGR